MMSRFRALGTGVSRPVDLATPPRVVRIGRARVPVGIGLRYKVASNWGIHLYFGEGRFSVCGHASHLMPGSVTVTPSGETSEYEVDRPLDHLFVHFAVRESDPKGTDLPLYLGPGDRADRIADSLKRALILARESASWAAALVWEVMHELASEGPPSAQLPSEPSRVSRTSEARTNVGQASQTRSGLKSARSSIIPQPGEDHLAQALNFVELHLPTRITLPSLAEEAGVSPTHLNRLFTAGVGTSAMSYVRERRMDLARYLLTSTSTPVKEIAYQVGIRDVHAFNKLCKKFFGVSPRRLRAEAESSS